MQSHSARIRHCTVLCVYLLTARRLRPFLSQISRHVDYNHPTNNQLSGRSIVRFETFHPYDICVEIKSPQRFLEQWIPVSVYPQSHHVLVIFTDEKHELCQVWILHLCRVKLFTHSSIDLKQISQVSVAYNSHPSCIDCLSLFIGDV